MAGRVRTSATAKLALQMHQPGRPTVARYQESQRAHRQDVQRVDGRGVRDELTDGICRPSQEATLRCGHGQVVDLARAPVGTVAASHFGQRALSPAPAGTATTGKLPPLARGTTWAGAAIAASEGAAPRAQARSRADARICG